MRQRPPTGQAPKPQPIPRAIPLEGGAPPPEVHAGGQSSPTAPIPVTPSSEAAEPPRPIPIAPASASAAESTPPAPIPAGAQPGHAAPLAPIPVQPAPNAPIPLTGRHARQGAMAVGQQGWQPGQKPVGVRQELEELAEEGRLALMWRNFIQEHRSWAVSAAFHAVLVMILGLLTLSLPRSQISLMSPVDLAEDLQVEDLRVLRLEGPEIRDASTDIVDRVEPESLEPMIDMRSAAEGIDAASVALSQFGIESAPYNDLLSELGTGTGQANARGTGKGRTGTGYGLAGLGGGMGGRGGRRANAVGRGATKESETAVDLALKWLAEHQLPDGSWSYNHQQAPTCQGKCPDPGEMPEARIAATAMGVLPFLGAGETNQLGRYQRTVAAGLRYLIQRMELRPQGGCLSESGGQMYSHGLATIALCEAYAMQVNPKAVRKMQRALYDGSGRVSPGETAPKANQEPIPVPGLGRAAQAALDFVAYAQDPAGGGWRYQPRQPGDTSMVGWHLMAWMSGKMSYLRVSPVTAVRANQYLNHVQVDDYGSNYGYTDKNRPTKATQAIGLLCRMYLGWPRDHPGIAKGVEEMSGSGPAHGYMYYDYYATQVLHHYGGEQWEQWNPRMRDSLVGSQSKAGHTEGSWHFPGGDRGASKGGRLYCTSLAAMTLEIYYRHMPLYGEDVLKHAGLPAEGDGNQEDNWPDE